MCVIVAVEGNEHPSEAMLAQCDEANPDGAGIAWINSNKMVQWKKGLADYHAILKTIVENDIKAPYVIHFRIPTVGDKSDALTHPFPISKDVELKLEGTNKRGVIFHNGTWNQWDNTIVNIAITKGKDIPDWEWSDSRAMAWVIYHTGLNTMELLLGRNPSRIALLNPDGIHYVGHWIPAPGHSGVYVSNDRWIPRPAQVITVNSAQPQQGNITYLTPSQATKQTQAMTITEKDTMGNIVVTTVETSGKETQEISKLNIDSWMTLTPQTAELVAKHVHRSVCTEKECIIDACWQGRRQPNDGDHCGKCGVAKDHWFKCVDLESQNSHQ